MVSELRGSRALEGEEGILCAYVDHFHVFDDGIREGQREDDLHLGSGNISVHRDVIHSVQQPQIRFRVLGICGNLR